MPKANGKKYNELTNEDKDKIIELYSSGLTYKEVIKQFPITKRALPKVIKEYGINAKRKNGYTLNEDYFEVIDTEHKAYWLGFIAADGCITETNYFAISLKDKDILEELKADIEFSGDIYSPKSNQGTYYRINFSSKKICDDLRKLGITERKSLSYNKLPNIRHGLLRHFIRGYFDGDGTIYSSITKTYNPNKTSFTNNYAMRIIATKDFCKALLNEIYSEIGYTGKITKSNNEYMFYYSIYKNQALVNFYWYLYHNSSIYLKRKHRIWLKFMGSLEEKSSMEKQGELLED